VRSARSSKLAGLVARLAVQVLGDDDSPIIPIMLYNPAKMPAFSRLCLERKLAVVVVGFPATPLIERPSRPSARTRTCTHHCIADSSVTPEADTCRTRQP
jgi:7-keto-8-aminopelargonate synthetase-like enzyme